MPSGCTWSARSTMTSTTAAASPRCRSSSRPAPARSCACPPPCPRSSPRRADGQRRWDERGPWRSPSAPGSGAAGTRPWKMGVYRSDSPPADRPLQLDQFGAAARSPTSKKVATAPDRLSAPTSLCRSREGPVIERERVVAPRRRALQGCRDRLGRVLACWLGVGGRTEHKRRLRSRSR